MVASNVGANLEIVQDGVTGFLVDTSEDWYQALAKLLNNRDLRLQMGADGRRRVEDRYCLQRTGPLLAALLFNSARSSSR